MLGRIIRSDADGALPLAGCRSDYESDNTPEENAGAWTNDAELVMPERMQQVSKVDWADIIGSAEEPLDFLLRRQLAVYIKVHREHLTVYRYYRLPSGTQMPRAGVVDEAAFLRLGNVGLAEIAASGSYRPFEFSEGGFVVPQPFDLGEPGRGGYKPRTPRPIEVAVVEPFDFDKAYVIDKKARKWAWATVAPIDMPAVERFFVTLEVGATDLYVLESDLVQLKAEATLRDQATEYPFSDAERRPVLFWMFQAAFVLNEQQAIERNGVKAWIKDRSSQPITDKGLKFAAKFAAKTVHRSKGRKGKKPKLLRIADLPNWAENHERFVFSFVSDGLTLMLAVADWWDQILACDSATSPVVLAKKLYAQNFDRNEILHATSAIAGSDLSGPEEDAFGVWADSEDDKARFLMVKELRLVL